MALNCSVSHTYTEMLDDNRSVIPQRFISSYDSLSSAPAPSQGPETRRFCRFVSIYLHGGQSSPASSRITRKFLRLPSMDFIYRNNVH
ncbi:hypothetical protein PAMP_015176 [Pampus punctatissimus]